MTQACIQKHKASGPLENGMLRKRLWSHVLGPVPRTGELEADPARARVSGDYSLWTYEKCVWFQDPRSRT